jgi:crotonobetainyl-CoA:carnitine CoA-transferase CaiB-like acyl-CoA transferase
MAGALDGLLVADFSRVLAGPYSSMMLADLGATVIKVERPQTGDDTRSWGPPFTTTGSSTYFESVNRNKHSLVLDLTNERDLRRARNLAAQSDIMIENFKAGGLVRYGLDYSNIRPLNPALIYCSITGFGNHAGKELPGYDLLVQAMGGLMSITGETSPTKTGVAVVDVLTGLHATVGILAALHSREKTGEGQLIEINLLSTLLASMVNQSSAYTMAGVNPGLLGNAHPSIAPYEVFLAADQALVIAVGNDSQFRDLCSALDMPDLAKIAMYRSNELRVMNRDSLKKVIEGTLGKATAASWAQKLNQVGVPCGPINTIAQAFELAEELGIDPIHNGQVASPLQLSSTPITKYRRPPHLGEMTEMLVQELALDS